MNRSRIRSAVALLGVLALLLAACGSSDGNADRNASAQGTNGEGDAPPTEKIEDLRIYHPETLAFAAPFALIGDDGPLSAVVDQVSDDTWSTPDELRGLLTSGKTDVTAVPTYVGANLANKGVDVKLAAVTVWGLLHLIGPEEAAPEWESLRGETVMMPFPNDMPDLVFRRLAEANGLEPGEDFEIENYATPQEAVMRLVSGNGQWAVLPEHVATVALANAHEQDRGLDRVLNLQESWAQIGGSDRIPQAGLVVPSSLAERDDVMSALFDALTDAVTEVNAADPATVEQLAETFDLPEGIVSDVIPRLNLEVVSGAEAKDELEAFFEMLAEGNPEIIGGELPPADFYLPEPK